MCRAPHVNTMYNALLYNLQGFENTERGKFEGGDADWEESRLKSYKNSELRLIEITEGLCKDLSTSKDQIGVSVGHL